MKQFLLGLLLLSGTVQCALAADGYNIKLKFSDYSGKKVFLAHYYGKPLPTIYKVDSGVVDKSGVVTLATTQKIIGGIYIMLLEGNTSYFEFLLDNGDKMDINVTAAKLPLGVSFKNSPENERFLKYVAFLSDVGKQHKALAESLPAAKSAKDSLTIQQKMGALSKEVSDFRNDYIKSNPKTMLANIFGALENPDVPQAKKADGTIDEDAQYRLYKKHFWDNVDFSDERLVYTPLLDSKLEMYFTRLVPSIPDTFSADADKIIAKARASKEVFKYVVHWLTTYAQESNIMGMDAVFVHLVENYYMKGDAFWLNSGTLQKYIDRAKSVAPNVIGNIAPPMKMEKRDGGNITLEDVDAKYTLLVFWSPDCGHCVEEVPRIDSAVKAAGLDKKGLKIIGFNIDLETEKWNKVIKDKKLSDNWIHVYDPKRISNYRAQYDVYGTPSIYLLDEKKIIRGKKLDHTNIGVVVDILEEDAATKK